MTKNGFISLNKDQKLHYRVFGDGERNLLCFHGFGQSAGVFEKLTEKHTDTQIISIDLPFHGESQFPLENFTKSTWQKLANEIFEKFQITTTGLIAYSLGGRFAMRTLMDFPEKISAATFIAADGFYFPKLYHIATSWPGKQVFKWIIDCLLYTSPSPRDA